MALPLVATSVQFFVATAVQFLGHQRAVFRGHQQTWSSTKEKLKMWKQIVGTGIWRLNLPSSWQSW